jgi:hypothetical protein
MVVGLIGMAAGNALIPLAPAGAALIAGGMLIVQQLVGDSSGTVYEVLEMSLTQTIVDNRILGRVNASIEFVTTLTALGGALAGGALAVAIGLRLTMAVGVLGAATAVLFIWFSPVRSLVSMAAPEATLPALRVEDLPVTE